MLINLSDVLSEQHKPIDVSVPLELEAVKLPGGPYTFKEKEPVELHIEYMKEKEIRIVGSTHLTVVIPCDRCLEPVDVPFSIKFDKNAMTGLSDAEQTDEESDYIDGYHLDVDKLLYNEILIGWPTKVLCKDDCKGICSVCGQNLNEGTCDCDDPGLDPRMSVIRDLFKNFKEV